MGKNQKNRLILLILIGFLALILGLAGGTGAGFFLANYKTAKTQSQSQSQTAQSTSQSQTDSSTTQKPKTKTAEPGYTIYTVQEGDTLYKIGLKFNIPWTEIAKFNKLSENSVIIPGQKLKIPVEGITGEVKIFEIDQDEMQALQQRADSGIDSWAKDPIEVAKRTVVGNFGITKDDIFSLKSRNFSLGEAEVEILHDSKIYIAELVQPVKKGEEGIWAVKRLYQE